MRRLSRFGVSLLLASALLQPGVVFAQPSDVTFSNPVEVGPNPTLEDILKQADQYKDGALELHDHRFLINEEGQLELEQPAKNIFCAWFGLFCPHLEAGPMTITREQAQQLVRSILIPQLQEEMRRDTGRVLPLLALSWAEPVADGTVIYQHNPENPPFNVLSDSWFFFIDLEPHALFGHRAEFVLVNGNTGEIIHQRVFGPPRIDGELVYFQYEDRFESEDRFYPEKIEDLGEPGIWPLEFESDSRPRPTPTEAEELTIRPIAPLSGFAESFSVTRAHAADAAAAADPCAGKTPKKVAVVIQGEHFDDGRMGRDFSHDTANITMTLKGLGFADADIHRFNPNNNPDLDFVWNKIKDKAKDLGPCDKFFFYITGHGTITDKDKDGKPDTPSWGVSYGAGDDSPTIAKGRWGKYSIMSLLEGIHAGVINLMFDSCYSGSMQTLVHDEAATPAPGTTWNIFASSTADLPSYSLQDRPGGEYTDVMAYCVRLKMAERGITNPSVQQMEEIMRECHGEIVANPNDHLVAPPTTTVEPMTITVEPSSTSIQEGNEGTRAVTFTIRRTPTNRPVSISHSTWSPDSGPFAFPGLDFVRIEDGKVEIPAGQESATVTVYIQGDTKVEEDEVVQLWFSDIGQLINITIIDDDGPPRSSSSSSSSSSTGTQAVSSSSSSEGGYTVTITFDEPIKVDPYGPITIYIPLDGEMDDGKEYKPSIGLEYVMPLDYEVKPDVKAPCPNCEEIADELNAAIDACMDLEFDLMDAEADLADLDRQIDDAQSRLDKANKALEDFRNPRSYAESEGRRVTSSDLAANRRWGQQQWAGYKNGDMTAQELEAKWKEGPSDADRQKMKDEIEAEMEQDIADLERDIDTYENERQATELLIDDLKSELDLCDEEIEMLMQALEECRKTCVEPEEDQESSEDSDDDEEDHDGDDDDEDEQSSSEGDDDDEDEEDDEDDDEEEDEEEEDDDESSSSSSSSSEKAPICKGETWEAGACEQNCKNGRCVKSHTNEGTQCYRCDPYKGEKSSESSKSSSSKSSTPSTVSCPNGTVYGKSKCEELCADDGGTCANTGNDCYKCTVLTCPSGTYKNECPSNCSAGCDVVGEEGNTKCYACKKSCEEVCSDYDQVGSNWNGYIAEYLSGYTCVSGANFAIETATIGSCTCTNQPQITVDQTKPVCRGTPCGDVQCGQSASCQTDPQTTVTVNCTWGGWQNTGQNQFVPVVGQ